MAFNDTSKINLSLKKLQGKAHTSNDKGLANEALPSGITSDVGTIFGESIPSSPTITNLYDRSGTGTFQVELVRFECQFIAGTDTSTGRHAFKLVLPGGYDAGSSHGPTGLFTSGSVVYSSSGALQLVPPSYGTLYEAKPFYGGSATKNSGTQIPVLDARDWALDYYNGIFFQQDPPGTDDHAQNPDYVEAFLYIGKYLDTVVASSGGGDVDGSGAANRIATWSDSNTLTSDADFTWNGTLLNVQGDSNFNGTVVINQSGADKDFRVETQNKSSALEVHGGTDQVLLFSGSLSDAAGHGSSPTDPDPKAFLDTNFFVSGSIGSRGTSTRGSSVFGGDVYVSGSIHGISSAHVLVADDTNLSNARVMTAGDGITISSATPRQIIISSTGLVSRSKRYFDVTGSHSAENVFSCAPIDFSNTNYSPDRIDVYLNGQHLRSGSANDYSLYSDSEIKFRHALFSGDAVLVITF